MEEVLMISIQEPEKRKLANLLKGIAILMKYDCTADINIGDSEGAFYFPTYVIQINADSEDFEKKDLEEIRQRMKSLAKEAQEARRPIPPEYLVDALQDPIHKEIGRSRVPKVVKIRGK